MKFTTKQAQAIDDAVAWFHKPGGKLYFKFFGYAGTGKTTLARYIADRLGATVYYCAFTGKAASVMRDKGCEGAMTLHRLIYRATGAGSLEQIKQLVEDLKAEEDPDERRRMMRELQQLRTPTFEPNPKSALAEADHSTTLVILDECSMIDERMGRHLLSFGVKVLALGDPAQLQPVKGKSFFSGQPDVLLDEIHRSEADSPVTYFATQVRQLGYMKGRRGDSKIVYIGEKRLSVESLMRFDQIITHTNVRRKQINRRIRTYYGRDPHRPVEGDRVMCLQNNYEFDIMNGEQYHVLGVEDQGRYWLLDLQLDATKRQVSVKASKQTFLDEDVKPTHLGCFTWGFATTAHKAQGSQWCRVMVIAEGYSFKTAGWLYTAITRASDRIVVVSTAR